MINELPSETRLTIVVTSRTFPGITDASKKLRDYVASHPRKGLVEFDYVVFDQLNMVSVLGACYDIKKRFNRLDYLILNSSYSRMVGVDYWSACKWFVKDPIFAFTTGPFKIQAPSGTSQDGIGTVYQANVLSPWFMINQLLGLLSAAKGRIIWISSAISAPECYDEQDIELKATNKSYEASKYEIELLHQATYKNLMDKYGVQSWVLQPGIFKSTTYVPTLDIVSYIGMMIMFYICRFIGSPYHCIEPDIAANAPVWLALKADPVVNDPSIKYGSSTDKWGNEKIMESTLNLDETHVSSLYKYTEGVRKEWEEKLKNQIIERATD